MLIKGISDPKVTSSINDLCRSVMDVKAEVDVLNKLVLDCGHLRRISYGCGFNCFFKKLGGTR